MAIEGQGRAGAARGCRAGGLAGDVSAHGGGGLPARSGKVDAYGTPGKGDQFWDQASPRGSL